MAEQNLIKTTDLSNARVREIEFAYLFNESVKKLVEALGVTRKIQKQAGAVLKTYKASGTLAEQVAEGETIALSKYTIAPVPYKEITLKKFRKATSAEAIVEYGYDQAVTMTTDRMLKDVQKDIRKDFFDFLADAGATRGESETDIYKGKGTKTSGTGLQAALANAWGELQVLFEDDEISSVYFLNPKAVSAYLGTASISTQTAFGMTYIKDFLGLGTVFLNSSVPVNKVYATAKDNLILYYIAVNGADLGEAFSFTSDETGYIGIHELADYTNMTAQDVVVEGIQLLAERIDGVVIATIA